MDAWSDLLVVRLAEIQVADVDVLVVVDCVATHLQ